MKQPVFAKDVAAERADWATDILQTDEDAFTQAERIVTKLGAQVQEAVVTFGFWAPELAESGIPASQVALELFTPQEAINLQAPVQRHSFAVTRLPVYLADEFCFSAATQLLIGNRQQLGTLYQLVYQDHNGVWQIVHDHLACSLPFGVFAPAEVTDIAQALKTRQDADYFSKLAVEPEPDGTPRVAPPGNILQIHVATATAEGTLSGLTKRYQEIASKLSANAPLSAADDAFIGYDALQLMPIEPTIVYEAGERFWEVLDTTDSYAEVQLRKPDTTNWGYDILISGSAAVNPAILAAGRPHELLELIEVLHTFPTQPISLILDIVYGHADNQAVGLLNRKFLAGPGMYGQNINFRQPVTRALMLEMQRRKSHYGIDGLRVDGAQDFKYWDEATESLEYDDDYLALMNNQTVTVAGMTYRPFMIFEDGRPWPRDDWELASSYYEVTKLLPNVFQWGPLTFAHNTPFLFTFWLSKWWRVREIADSGSNWITGCANHDTLRRGTQVDPDLGRINTYLGKTLPAIFRRAYDHPAAKLLDYAFMPGIPMDFIHASLRAPWSFIRNTDDRYGVKVVSEEYLFLTWGVTEESYSRPEHFGNLKRLGFIDLGSLQRFVTALHHAVKLSQYNLDMIAVMLEPYSPAGALDPAHLKRIARAWMDDVHRYCNLAHYEHRTEKSVTTFMHRLRQFRQTRNWLRHNLGTDDTLEYRNPTQGSVLYYGQRRAPDGEKLLFIANMEGERCQANFYYLFDLPDDVTLTIQLTTPGVTVTDPQQPIRLADGEGVVLSTTG